MTLLTRNLITGKQLLPYIFRCSLVVNTSLSQLWPVDQFGQGVVG